MSNINQISRIAFLVSAAISLAACSDGGGDVSGGGGVGTTPTAADFCEAVATDNLATTYSGTVSNLITDGTEGSYQFSVIEEPSRGSVTMDPSTGDYTYTADNGRGYEASFQYAIEENGTQLDSAEVALIFGSKRIMPLGDSITYGVTSFSGPVGNLPLAADAVGYRKALYDRLSAEGYAVDFVGPQSDGASTGLSDTDHAGIPGDEANEMYAGISNWLLTNKTDVVLLHAGTNDLFQQDTTAEAVAEVSALVANLESWQISNSLPLSVMAAKIIPPHPSALQPVTAASLTPIFATFNTDLETALTTATYSADFQLTMVDQQGALTAATDMTNSSVDTVGLHPTDGGYSKMATTWYNSLISAGELVKCN